MTSTEMPSIEPTPMNQAAAPSHSLAHLPVALFSTVMGSAGLADHTAMGECVNKAFRLETVSKTLDWPIAVGQGAYEYLDVLPALRTRLQPHTARLKGYAQDETVYAAEIAQLCDALGAV